MDAREVIRNSRAGTFAVVYIPNLSTETLESPVDLLSAPALGAHGSAVAIGVDRFITCSHVIEPFLNTRGSLLLAAAPRQGPPEIVYLVNKVVGDANLDLALMSASPKLGEAVPLGLDTRIPEMGLEVVCLGVPFAEKEGSVGEREVNVKISLPLRAVKGIVSSSVHENGRLEVDVQLNPGMSGGPVLSLESGLVTGICEGFGYVRGDDVTYTASLSQVLAAFAISRRLEELEARLASGS